MYVFILHMCIYIYISVCLFVGVYVFVFVCLYVCMSVGRYVSARVCFVWWNSNSSVMLLNKLCSGNVNCR